MSGKYGFLKQAGNNSTLTPFFLPLPKQGGILAAKTEIKPYIFSQIVRVRTQESITVEQRGNPESPIVMP